jgi:Protein of unknown function (DUF2934)
MASKAPMRTKTEREPLQQEIQSNETVKLSERPLPLKLSEAQIRDLVAETAYYRAEQRGFAPGCEIEDWLAAEVQVMTRLTPGSGQSN